MAGEFLVVNPRRRRHRRKRARATRRRSRVRRRRVSVSVTNPRRVRRGRRRATRSHRRRSRARRNPRIPFVSAGVTGNLMRGLSIGAGAVATNLATGFISKYLPADWQTGPIRLAVKAGVGLIVLPAVLGFVPGGRKFAGSVAVGAGVVIALDLFTAYIAPSLGLSDYDSGVLQDYEQGALGAADVIPDYTTSDQLYGGGIYG